MNVVLWVLQWLLAVAFLLSGLLKLTQSKDAIGKRLAWVEDVSPPMIKLIGFLEVLASVGLILPGLLHIAPVLTPLAAGGLVVIMIGAVVTHARRNERSAIAVNIVLMVLAAVVVWGRLGPSPLG
jgi:uncharacterized membrane protein YphA (DoxX/SURF4 family)